MKTCHCGKCELCDAKQRVLDFARSHAWAPFEWTVCSTICGGEDKWHIFVDTHDLDELNWVLRVIKEHEQASQPATLV